MKYNLDKISEFNEETEMYEGQYFHVNFFPGEIPKNPTISDIQFIEWTHMQRELNNLATNPRDNSYVRKIEGRKIILDRNLKAYISIPDHREEDFLKHLQNMLENYNEYMTDSAVVSVREWLSNRLTLLSYSVISKDNKTPEQSPKEFAMTHWEDLVTLIRKNDGVVMKAVKDFCADIESHPDIVSLSKAVSRLCDARNVKRNKNFRQGLDV